MKAPAESTGARKIIIGVVVLLTVCVVALVITGLTSLISLADRIHPLAGAITFWTIVLAASFGALYLAIEHLALEEALTVPLLDDLSVWAFRATVQGVKYTFATYPVLSDTAIRK